MNRFPVTPADAPQGHRWTIADSLTALRLAAALILLAPLPAGGFLAVYTLAGLTDVLDGWLARKTGSASQFGAKLDSIADLVFYGVLLVRLVPLLWLTMPETLWYFVAAAALTRLAAYCTAAIRYHRFAALHTWLNKLTGGAVFLLPYVLTASYGILYCWAVCALALLSSAEELTIHLCSGEYDPNRKSIFC